MSVRAFGSGDLGLVSPRGEVDGLLVQLVLQQALLLAPELARLAC